MRAVVLVLALVLAAGCAGRAATTSRTEPRPEQGEARADYVPTPLDAGTMICAHDVKDTAACVQDCDRGIPSACAELASRAERERNLPSAVRLHERACELRDAASCVSAARMHLAGLGVPPNRARQVELLAAACRLGDTLACAVPARAYTTGNGVPKDERRALDLWQRACAAGSEPACDAIADAGS